MNISKRSIKNFFLYFCHDLAIEAYYVHGNVSCQCIFKERVSSTIVNLCKSACKLRMEYGVRLHNSIVFDSIVY